MQEAGPAPLALSARPRLRRRRRRASLTPMRLRLPPPPTPARARRRARRAPGPRLFQYLGRVRAAPPRSHVYTSHKPPRPLRPPAFACHPGGPRASKGMSALAAMRRHCNTATPGGRVHVQLLAAFDEGPERGLVCLAAWASGRAGGGRPATRRFRAQLHGRAPRRARRVPTRLPHTSSSPYFVPGPPLHAASPGVQPSASQAAKAGRCSA